MLIIQQVSLQNELFHVQDIAKQILKIHMYMKMIDPPLSKAD